MKERKYLGKYKRSTYKGERILCIDVFFDSQNSYIELKTKYNCKSFFVPTSIGCSDSLLDYSADYLLCSLQYIQNSHCDLEINK